MREFSLAQPRTCTIVPVTLSGLTPSGLYILDHDNVRDMNKNRFSMDVRVTKVGRGCYELVANKVYVVKDPYNYTVMDIDEERFYIMHEDNIMCEIEGYDERTQLLQQEHDDKPELYGVCAK